MKSYNPVSQWLISPYRLRMVALESKERSETEPSQMFMALARVVARQMFENHYLYIIGRNRPDNMGKAMPFVLWRFAKYTYKSLNPNHPKLFGYILRGMEFSFQLLCTRPCLNAWERLPEMGMEFNDGTTYYRGQVLWPFDEKKEPSFKDEEMPC